MNDSRTFIITGANAGLGFACAQKIAAASARNRVILACRSMAKARKAKEEIVQSSGNESVIPMELDVSLLASVRAFAAQVRARADAPFFGLVCNAGIVGMHTGLTGDGFDIVFETNHLGHFLLTGLLLPLMAVEGRVVAVSSDMHNPPGGPLTWPGVDALAHPDEKLGASPSRYSFSKLCNLYFAYELSGRLAHIGSGIAVNAFNPGLMTETNFAPDKSRFTPEFLQKVSDRIGSLDASSKALAKIMTESQYGNVTGAYFDRSTKAIPSSPLSYNQENARELWNASVRYAKLAPDETLPGLLAERV